MENITIKDVNLARHFDPIIIINKSYVQITKSNFVNNKVDHGIIQVLDSSDLKISDCVVQNNQAKTSIGAIYAQNSTIYIINTNFYYNKAVHTSGACSLLFSTAVLINCAFWYNSDYAVLLQNHTIASILNCTFQSNSGAWTTGALFINEFSFVNVSHTKFLKNSGPNGGAILATRNSSLLVKKCSFSQNAAVMTNKDIAIPREFGGAIFIAASMLKIVQSQFHNNYADSMGGSVFSSNGSTLLISDTLFENNTAGMNGGAIMIDDQSYLTIDNSSLTNNSALEGSGGGLYMIMNSTAIISSVHFFENKAKTGDAILASDFCRITISNISFISYSGLVIYIQEGVSLRIDHCIFYNNLAGVLLAASSSVHVTKSVFCQNTEGTISVQESSNIFITNCSFTDNSAFKGGALKASNSNIKVISSKFIGNSATSGGVFALKGNLLVIDCIMNNNTATADGGVGYLEDRSQISIINSTFNSNLAVGSGGVLWLKNSNASVQNSSFIGNWAKLTGGVFNTQVFSVINISQTICLRNKAGSAGVLDGRTSTKIYIRDSILQQNSAKECGTVVIMNASVLRIILSKVDSNKADMRAGAFCVFNNSLFISKHSLFKGNHR